MEAPSLWVGQTIDKYTLDKFLGRGAFGEVLRGMDVETGQHYAVKIIEKANLSGMLKENSSCRVKIIRGIEHHRVHFPYSSIRVRW